MKIEKLDYYGRGITYIDGKICFVKNALPKEEVFIEEISKKKRYIEAVVTEIKIKSKDRVSPKCPYYFRCGACHLLHMKEERREDFKWKKVKGLVEKNFNSDILIRELELNKQEYYRNKVTFHVKDSKLGYYKENTNDLVEIDSCFLLDKKLISFIPFLKQFVKKEPHITTITMKLGNKTKEVMAVIDGQVSDYHDLLKVVDVLIINHQVVSKKGSILSKIGKKTYLVSQNSFFQVNQYMVENLYKEILNNIKKYHSKNVLDLYCGTGTISIYISDSVEKVVGIEVVEDAIRDANRNKKINQAKNVEFILGKVEDKINDIHSFFDTIIVDPPRGGLDSHVIEVIEKMKSKIIIYVSCDLFTLVRDLKYLENDYHISYIKPFDMFPNTHHVECLTLLSLKE